MKFHVGLLCLSLLIGTVLGQGSVCDTCIQAAQTLKDDLDFASTPRGLLEFKERVCGALPAPVQEICGQVIDGTFPVLRQNLEKPVKVCGDIGLCSAEEQVVKLSQSNSDDINCPLCKYFVSFVKEQLQDPETEAELIDQANQVCGSLPEDVKPQCVAYIAQYSQQIFAAIHEANPEEVCAIAGLCDQSLRFPKLSHALKSKFDELNQIRDDDQCNTCQLVIVQASSYLADPDTQKEILAYVKQSCDNFATFEDQCRTYVDLYGPLALSFARQYLTPDLCVELGFCPKADSEIPFAS